MKYLVHLLVALGVMLLSVSCGLFSFLGAPLEDEELEYLSFYVKTEDLPNAFKVDRFFVTDDSGAQIGAGVKYSGDNAVVLSIPSSYAGQELNVCAGYSVIRYAAAKTAITENMTVTISAEDVDIGVPGGILPKIPNVISSGEVVVVNTQVAGAYSISDVYVTSYGGSRISTAMYDANTGKWSLNMPDSLSGTELRFWVDYTYSGRPYCFYDDIVWQKNVATNITITYLGTPITNHAQLRSMGSSGDFVITNAISVGAAPWVPIDMFQGTLHGGGYKISGIKFERSTSAGSYGFFRKLNGNVSDLKLEYADTAPLVLSATAPTNDGGSFAMAGVLAGEVVSGSEIKNVMVLSADKDSSFLVKSAVPGSSDVYLGGIVGYHGGGTLLQSYSNILVELVAGSTNDHRYFIGGLAGVSKGHITHSYSRGGVSANNAFTTGSVYAGGLAGWLNGASIYDSYATGDILATIDDARAIVSIGGLAGTGDAYYQIIESVAANGKVRTGESGDKSVGFLIGSSPNVTGSSNKWKNTMQLTGSNVYDSQEEGSSLMRSDWPLLSLKPWLWDDTTGYPCLYWQQSSIDIFDKLDLNVFLDALSASLTTP
jgi:hypothetical protein